MDRPAVSEVLISAIAGVTVVVSGVGSFSPASLPWPSPSGSGSVPSSDRSVSCGLVAEVWPLSWPSASTTAWFSQPAGTGASGWTRMPKESVQLAPTPSVKPVATT